MHALIQRVARSIERRRMLDFGTRLGVAVSGGADSVCLLQVLVELSPQLDLKLHVLHLNHGLRGDESRGDGEFVRDLAQELDLPFTLREIDLSVAGGNLEEAARHARLAFFAEMIDSGTVECVAVGHTKSDQAETVLFRFMRGSGTAGLAGIRPVTSSGIIRPLIDLDRSEIEGFLRDRNIPWRDDSTNTADRFARNRIRHDLIPQLAREWNPAIVDLLAQTADWAAAEESWWEAEIDRLAGCLEEKDGAILAPREAIAALPTAPARRLVRRAIERAKGDLRQIDFRHVETVLGMATGPRGHGRVQLPGLEVLRSFDWLRFGVPAVPHGPYSLVVSVPGLIRVPAAGAAFRMELVEKSETSEHYDCVYNGVVGCIDWSRVSGPLEMRNWRPGDRYQPLGSSGPQKLKSLFQEARIPIWNRRNWPVLTNGTTIVWVWRFGPAVDLAVGAQTSAILRIRDVAPA